MTDDLLIRLGLLGQAETSRGLKQIASDTRQVGASADYAAARAKAMGAAWKESSRNIGIGIGHLQQTLKYTTLGFGALAGAGALWGLKLNAQVQSARERFRLFTNDVNGLTASVKHIDLNSQFNFGDLADAAAMLGNSNVRNIPHVLQGAANAAAASGRGTQALQSIVLALSQIQQKGRLSQEELNQLAEAGAPQVMNTIQKAYGLTAKQLGNIGANGLDATKAIQALTKEWTSGRMAGAASRQLNTLGGQWQLLTGALQEASAAATQGLAAGLAHNVLPAANAAVAEITQILGEKGLSNHQKLEQSRAAIRKHLGPVADDLIQDIKQAHLAEKLTAEFDKALNGMAASAVTNAPHIVGSFVDAWLGAGPWAQLISGGWFIRKLGLDKGVLAALRVLRGGSGRGASGALGALGGRGATPLNPVWVAVTDKAPSKSVATKALDVTKKIGPAVGAAATRALPLVGDFAGPGAALAIPLAAALYDNQPKPTQPAGRTVGQIVNGHDNYIGPPRRSMVQITVNVDGHPVATAVHRDDSRVRARK
jgi:tape measure domain-containing protein